MELRLLPLISYLAAGTYLMAWSIHQSWRLQVKIRAWSFQHQAAGRVRSLKSSGINNDWIGILLNIGGAILGVFTAHWAVAWISTEWLLLVLLAFVFLSEEFRPSQAEMNLLAVVVLMDRVIAHTAAGSDLFEVLSKAVQELPEGEVQQALREALHRRRSGVATEECLTILRGIDPCLDEFILTLRRLDWQAGPALLLVAERLQQRADRRWDRASRYMLLKEHVWPYIRVGRAAMIAALFVLSYNGVAMHFTAWPSHITVVWIGLALIAAGLLLNFALTSEWPRRVLALSLLLVAFFPMTNRIDIQSPWWIQIHAITHVSEHLSDSRPWKRSQVSQWQAQSMFNISPVSVPFEPGNRDSSFLPIPTPSQSITNVITTSISTPPIYSDVELEELCCHRLYQPR